MDKVDLKDCRFGKHPLITILTTRNDGYDDYFSVVRWCPVCGAIVVDAECDGRTYTGRMVGMRIPKLPKLIRNLDDWEKKEII